MSWNRSVAQKPVRRKRSPWGLLSLVAVVLACSAVAYFTMMPERVESGRVGQAEAKKLKRNRKQMPRDAEAAVRAVLPQNLPNQKKKRRPVPTLELFDHLTGEERKCAEAVQAALDADDFAGVQRTAKKALASSNPELRQHAIEALGWFGAKALPELTGCMADADEDVRQAAAHQWEQSLEDVEDTGVKLDVAMAAFATLKDPDQLTMLSGIMSGAATELIDSEENETVAAEKRLSVVQGLVDIIEGEGTDPRNVAAAKEAYNDITGNEWISFEEAGRYLENPENYDPDEAPVESGPQ